ncbi:MAG: zinc ribbon domain-containing protein [Anaerolineales bacterium]|nr:zinc ribbon domain-containing protein [Anaerolineales bacterium]
MNQRIYHGAFTPDDFSRSLLGAFNRSPLRARILGDDDEQVVQINTGDRASSGGATALAVTLRQVDDGVSVEVSKQQWLGVAASLGQTVLTVWRNPFGLIDRLDDLAADVQNLQLAENVWEVIDETARSLGATMELSERLRRLVCEYCLVANPVGESNCIACGAPLGAVQPRTCKFCGFVIKTNETTCPNCGKKLDS